MTEAQQAEAPPTAAKDKEQPQQAAEVAPKPTASTPTATKARAALQGVWGSFSAFANRVVHAVENEAANIKSEQQAMKKEAALAREPPPAAVPPWLDFGTASVSAQQRDTVTRMVLALTSAASNFLTIPVPTQTAARRQAIARHGGDAQDLTPAERKHVANTEEDPEKDGFAFELSAALPAAEAALRADPKLALMRNALVPRRISERNFWRNWLWRVHAIKATHGVTWPTPGIVTMKTATVPAAGAGADDEASAIEEEITKALGELDDAAPQQQPQQQDKSDKKEQETWEKEVEEALADK